MNRDAPRSLTATAQVIHQLRIEWQHHRVWVLGYLSLTILRLLYRLDPWWQTDMRVLGEPHWFWMLVVMVPVAITIRVILADPPVSTDLGTHTRPVSRWSLWIAKLVFLLMTLVLPWLLADAWLWRGLGHSLGGFLSLAIASLMTILLLVLSGAAVAGTATSGAQLTLAGFGLFILFFAAQTGVSRLVTWAGWDGFNAYSPKAGYPSAFMAALPWLVTVLLALGAWLLAIQRRRRASYSLLAMAVLVVAGSQAWMLMGWWLADEIQFSSRPLELKTGRGADNGQASVQTLWPTLHLAGLPPNHLASVISFTPPELDWRKFRQNPENKNEPTYWADNESSLRTREMARIIFRGYGKTDLWFHPTYLDIKRDSLSRVIGPVLPAAPWRLRLAVYEVHQVLDLPLSAFVGGSRQVILKEGQQMELDPLREENSSLRLRWRWRTQRSALSPESAARFRPGSLGGAEALGCLAVVQDVEARENFLLSAGGGGEGNVDRGLAWIQDMTYGGEFFISKPLARMQLTGLKLEDWINQVRVQLWLSEDRGITNLEVSPEQMKQMLEMP